MQTHKNLDDLFRQTRTDRPVLSETELDGLLDRVDALDGGHTTNPATDPSTPLALTNTTGIVMSILSIVVVGAIAGSSFFFNSNDPTTSVPTNDIATVDRPIEPTFDNLAFADFLGMVRPTADPVLDITADESSTLAANHFTSQPILNDRDPDNTFETEEPATPTEKFQKRLHDEIGDWVIAYWEDRINRYRRYVDNVLPASDRAELDRLRVRWGLAETDESFGLTLGMHQSYSNGDEKIDLGFGYTEEGADNFKMPEMSSFPQLHDLDQEELTQMQEKLEKLALRLQLNTEDLDEEVEDMTILLKDLDIDIDIDESAEKMIIIRGTDSDPEALRVKISALAEEMEDAEVEVRKTINKVRTIMVRTDETEERLESAEALGEALTARTRSTDEKAESNSFTRSSYIRKMIVDGNGEMLMGSDPSMGLSEMMKTSIAGRDTDASSILRQTWALAERNRADLDELRDTLLADVDAFTVEMRNRINTMLDTHGDELPADLVRLMRQTQNEEGSAMDAVAKTIAPIYEVVAEPLILLYSGADLSPVLSSAVTRPVTGMKLEARNALDQSFPNPASSDATIRFDLGDDASNATLRLFDAEGSTVLVKELGATPAGPGSTTIDVSDLPNGSYLYQLTVTTSEGERVHARPMQIVR